MGDIQTNLRASIPSQPFFFLITFCEQGRWEKGIKDLHFELGSDVPLGMKLDRGAGMPTFGTERFSSGKARRL